MFITPLGHSCFLLEESTGTTVVTDPYSSDIGITLPPVSADMVTVSHAHYDHNNVAAVSGNPMVIDRPGMFEVKGVQIFGLNTYHDEVKGKKRGSNVIFNIRMDGVNVCHLGDVGHGPSPLMIEAIGPVDILLVPVGGKYTIDAEVAKEYVDRLMPSVIIPMHYKVDDVDMDIDGVDAFLDYFDKDDIEYTSENKVEFDRSDFDDEYSMKVICFDKN